MNLLTAELSLLVALGSGYSATDLSDAGKDEVTPGGAHACEDLLEVPQGEFDPTSIPSESGIVWYGTWEDALAERDRTGKPVALHFGSPRRPKDFVCVPGAW
jgi:hypothetical protein